MEAIRNSAEHAALKPLEALRQYQAEVSEELNHLAQKHADSSEGMLTLLDIDPEQYHAQKITRAWVDSTPDTLEEIMQTAEDAEPHYPEMLKLLMGEEASTNALSHLGEDLASGQNIVVVTNHGEIKDIAITLAAYYAGIKTTGETKGRNYDFSTNILLSKMVAHLGFYGIPVTDVLGKMCDRQYFSFPKTDSIKNSMISPMIVDTYNGALRAAIKLRMQSGKGNLFAIAPSGTIDKALNPDDTNTLTMATVGKGTAKLLTAKDTKVLPVAIWNNGSEGFIFEPLSIPRHLEDDTEVHAMMMDISNVLNQTVDEKTFLYHPPIEQL